MLNEGTSIGGVGRLTVAARQVVVPVSEIGGAFADDSLTLDRARHPQAQGQRLAGEGRRSNRSGRAGRRWWSRCRGGRRRGGWWRGGGHRSRNRSRQGARSRSRGSRGWSGCGSDGRRPRARGRLRGWGRHNRGRCRRRGCGRGRLQWLGAGGGKGFGGQGGRRFGGGGGCCWRRGCACRRFGRRGRIRSSVLEVPVCAANYRDQAHPEQTKQGQFEVARFLPDFIDRRWRQIPRA